VESEEARGFAYLRSELAALGEQKDEKEEKDGKEHEKSRKYAKKRTKRVKRGKKRVHVQMIIDGPSRWIDSLPEDDEEAFHLVVARKRKRDPLKCNGWIDSMQGKGEFSYGLAPTGPQGSVTYNNLKILNKE
jgi:hypothetical protein